MSKNLVGMFLSYYEDYFESALDEFVCLLRATDLQYTCIVVTNGNIPIHLIDRAKNIGCIIVQGDNSHGEFSGWQVGLEFLRITGKLHASDEIQTNFIFANDTFNQHRKWNCRSRLSLLSGVHESFRIRGRPCLIGHGDSPTGNFSMFGIPFNGWVSTFLFVCTYDYLEGINWDLLLSDEQLEKTYSEVLDSGIQWREGISQDLRDHIDRWLFPAVGQHSWYGAGSKTPQQKRYKLNAILNEKWLSAQLMIFDGHMISWRTRNELLSLVFKNPASVLNLISYYTTSRLDNLITKKLDPRNEK